jgi:hypothetical protein
MQNTVEISSNRQLARLLGVTPTHAANLINSGELKPTKIGLSTRTFRQRDIDAIRQRQLNRLAEKRETLGVSSTNALAGDDIQALLESNRKVLAAFATLDASHTAMISAFSKLLEKAGGAKP